MNAVRRYFRFFGKVILVAWCITFCVTLKGDHERASVYEGLNFREYWQMVDTHLNWKHCQVGCKNSDALVLSQEPTGCSLGFCVARAKFGKVNALVLLTEEEMPRICQFLFFTSGEKLASRPSGGVIGKHFWTYYPEDLEGVIPENIRQLALHAEQNALKGKIDSLRKFNCLLNFCFSPVGIALGSELILTPQDLDYDDTSIKVCVAQDAEARKLFSLPYVFDGTNDSKAKSIIKQGIVCGDQRIVNSKPVKNKNESKPDNKRVIAGETADSLKNQVKKEQSKDCTDCRGKAEEIKVCSPIPPKEDSLPQQVDNSNFANVAKSRSCEDLFSSDISGKQLPFVDRNSASSIRRSQIFYSNVSVRDSLESKGRLGMKSLLDAFPVGRVSKTHETECLSAPSDYRGGTHGGCVDTNPDSMQRLEDSSDFLGGANPIQSSASTGEYRRTASAATPFSLKRDGKRWLLVDARGVVCRKRVSRQLSGVSDTQQKTEVPGERKEVFFMHEEKTRFIMGCYVSYVSLIGMNQPRVEFFLNRFFGE